MSDRSRGVAVGISHQGRIVYADGFGFADVELSVPATKDTVYRIGSITKQFTAAAILKLEREARLDLADLLETHFPDYPTQGNRITIEQLLNHTSGIKGYTEMPEFWEKSRLDLSSEEMVEMFSSAPFEFEPGERYQYNNSGYFLLGLLIEKLSGQSYAEFLEQRFFGPHALQQTYYLDEERIIPHRAEGYELRDGELVNDEFLSMDLPYSAGSMGSTVSDLLRWQHLLQQGDVVGEGYRRMIQPGKLIGGESFQYGLGIALREIGGVEKIGHGGGINGFSTQLSYYPTEELGIAVLANLGSARAGALESRIARVLLDLDAPVHRPVELDADTLATYAGTYHPGRSPLTIRFEEGSLLLGSSKLTPKGNHRFFDPLDPEASFRFEVEDGRVVALVIEREGDSTTARRVSDDTKD